MNSRKWLCNMLRTTTICDSYKKEKNVSKKKEEEKKKRKLCQIQQELVILNYYEQNLI